MILTVAQAKTFIDTLKTLCDARKGLRKVIIEREGLAATNGHVLLCVGELVQQKGDQRQITLEDLKALVKGKKGTDTVDLWEASSPFEGVYPTFRPVFDPDEISHVASVAPIGFRAEYIALAAKVAAAFRTHLSLQTGDKLSPTVARSVVKGGRGATPNGTPDWFLLIMPIRL